MREKGREGRQERAGGKIGRKEGERKGWGRGEGTVELRRKGKKKAQHSTRNEPIGKEMKMGKMLIVFRLIPNLIKVGGKF